MCSNYSYDTVDSTWQNIRNFRGGNALFTHPSGAVKCGGAPQKIMYLADDYFRQAGRARQVPTSSSRSPMPNIFAVDQVSRRRSKRSWRESRSIAVFSMN